MHIFQRREIHLRKKIAYYIQNNTNMHNKYELYKIYMYNRLYAICSENISSINLFFFLYSIDLFI